MNAYTGKQVHLLSAGANSIKQTQTVSVLIKKHIYHQYFAMNWASDQERKARAHIMSSAIWVTVV